MFGKGSSIRPFIRECHPALEALERRLAPICSPFYSPAAQFLRVTCDAAPDQIDLRVDPASFIRLNGQMIPGGPNVNNTLTVVVDGGPGDDWIDLVYMSGFRGRATVTGGLGNDVILGSDRADVLRGSQGHDFVWGYYGEDTIEGGHGHDYLMGYYGNDTIEGGDGHDYLMGGEDNDAIYMTDQTRACASEITYDFGMGEGGDDTLIGDLCGLSNDYLDGGWGNDLIMGIGLSDTCIGGDGNDEIYGGDGEDYLFGDYGNDSLDGGAGSDYMDGGTDIGGGDVDRHRSDLWDWVENCELPW